MKEEEWKEKLEERTYFSIIPSKEHPGLISFRMDWLDLLVLQGTLKSPLQHHSSKASILQRSAFFTYVCFPEIDLPENSWGCKESDTTERLNSTTQLKHMETENLK